MVLKQLFGTGKSETKKPQVSAVPERQAANREPDSPKTPSSEHGETPTAASHLESAMQENARNDNGDTRFKVYQELLFSDLLLALADSETANPNPTPEQGMVNVAILSNPQNVKFAAAFTSAEASKRWRPEGGNYVTVRGQRSLQTSRTQPSRSCCDQPRQRSVHRSSQN